MPPIPLEHGLPGSSVCEPMDLVQGQFDPCEEIEDSSTVSQDLLSQQRLQEAVSGQLASHAADDVIHNDEAHVKKHPKYLSCCLQNSVQLVPTCFMFFRGVEFTAIYLRRNNNVSCVYEVISSLKYILKVKLSPNFYPNILSEIIGLHENEGCGGNL